MSAKVQLLKLGVPERLVEQTGSLIGKGTEGVIYALSEHRILKVNLTAPRTQSIAAVAKRANKSKWSAHIYEYGRCEPRGFWYTSERLYKVPERARVLLNVIGLSYVAWKRGRMTKAEHDERVKGAIERMPAQLQTIVKSARKAGYVDVHGANVMITKSGIYKFIDPESISRVV